jgi:hypothetical protein
LLINYKTTHVRDSFEVTKKLIISKLSFMKKKIMLGIFMLAAIKNFSQNISLTIPASVQINSIDKIDPPVVMEQRQVLYKQMLNNEINYGHTNTENNFMRSSSRQLTMDTSLVVPHKHSVWKSAGIGMLTGLVVGAILGAVTANPDEFFGYTAGEGALALGSFGAAFGGVSGLIVGVIQNVSSKKPR